MFSIEGKFFKTLMRIGDFLILGFVGILFSLPVITLGASLTGMFYAGMKLVRDEESYVVKDFWHGFKGNIKQSILIELIIGVAAAVLICNIFTCLDWMNTGGLFPELLMYGTIGLVLVLVGIAIYAFPILAKFENTVFGTLKNALLLCMKHLPQTFIMLICNVGITYYSLGYAIVFVLTIPLMLYVDCYIMSRVFAPYVKNQEAVTDDVIEGREVADGETVTADDEAADDRIED